MYHFDLNTNRRENVEMYIAIGSKTLVLQYPAWRENVYFQCIIIVKNLIIHVIHNRMAMSNIASYNLNLDVVNIYSYNQRLNINLTILWNFNNILKQEMRLKNWKHAFLMLYGMVLNLLTSRKCEKMQLKIIQNN